MLRRADTYPGAGGSAQHYKPYKEKPATHGHGSIAAQKLSVKFKIDTFLSGGKNPEFSENEKAVLTDADIAKVEGELSLREAREDDIGLGKSDDEDDA